MSTAASEPNWEAIADAAYMAYGLSTGGKNFRGEPMPDWSDLPETIRSAWKQAARAAVLQAAEEGVTLNRTFYTCPSCGYKTREPEDVASGYCTKCGRFHGTDEV